MYSHPQDWGQEQEDIFFSTFKWPFLPATHLVPSVSILHVQPSLRLNRGSLGVKQNLSIFFSLAFLFEMFVSCGDSGAVTKVEKNLEVIFGSGHKGFSLLQSRNFSFSQILVHFLYVIMVKLVFFADFEQVACEVPKGKWLNISQRNIIWGRKILHFGKLSCMLQDKPSNILSILDFHLLNATGARCLCGNSKDPTHFQTHSGDAVTTAFRNWKLVSLPCFFIFCYFRVFQRGDRTGLAVASCSGEKILVCVALSYEIRAINYLKEYNVVKNWKWIWQRHLSG